ncbi:MAG: flagellar basal body-associated FliL family protein [Nitrospirae bacterium]|nr:flagellar basal body-associated FliL family protein [Nitrospirota bacterium]
MAEETGKDQEKEEGKAEEAPKKKKAVKSKKAMMMIIIGVSVAVVLGVGGFFGYKMISGSKGQAAEKKHDSEKTLLVGIDPFVLNLADQGRYLKFTIQLELNDEKMQSLVTDKSSQIRDAIIMLVGNKPAQSIASTEGKFQLKDEILLRVNQIMGPDANAFKNLYFTEFVMQ